MPKYTAAHMYAAIAVRGAVRGFMKRRALEQLWVESFREEGLGRSDCSGRTSGQEDPGSPTVQEERGSRTVQRERGSLMVQQECGVRTVQGQLNGPAVGDVATTGQEQGDVVGGGAGVRAGNTRQLHVRVAAPAGGGAGGWEDAADSPALWEGLPGSTCASPGSTLPASPNALSQQRAHAAQSLAQTHGAMFELEQQLTDNIEDSVDGRIASSLMTSPVSRSPLSRPHLYAGAAGRESSTSGPLNSPGPPGAPSHVGTCDASLAASITMDANTHSGVAPLGRNSVAAKSRMAAAMTDEELARVNALRAELGALSVTRGIITHEI